MATLTLNRKNPNSKTLNHKTPDRESVQRENVQRGNMQRENVKREQTPRSTKPLPLEQQRAQDTWRASEHYGKEEVMIAKSLPALIMNSGLMQVLAFCHQKGGKHEAVAMQLRHWLSHRFPQHLPNAEFVVFMEALMQTRSRDFQAMTTEALAWLKWLRQIAAARQV